MAETELNITKKDNGFCINNPEFFLTFSDFLVSDGIDIVENINILKGKYDFEELAEATEDFNQLEASYISHCANSINYFHNKYGDLELFTFMESDVEIEKFTDKLDVELNKQVSKLTEDKAVLTASQNTLKEMEAPICENDYIGKLIIYNGEEKIEELCIRSNVSIERLTFLDYFYSLLKNNLVNMESAIN